VPMLMVFKAVCDHVDGLQGIADLLGTSDEQELPVAATCDSVTS